MLLLAIDPGVDTGWAVFTDIGLIKAGLGESWPHLDQATRAFIEMPLIYAPKSGKGDPNKNIAPLILRVGRYFERLEARGIKVTLIYPRDWKGTIDGDIMTARILQGLTPEDRATLDRCLLSVAKGKQHNTIDAVGLGKHALKMLRLEYLKG